MLTYHGLATDKFRFIASSDGEVHHCDAKDCSFHPYATSSKVSTAESARIKICFRQNAIGTMR